MFSDVWIDNIAKEPFVDASPNWHSAHYKETFGLGTPHVISATVSALLVEAF